MKNDHEKYPAKGVPTILLVDDDEMILYSCGLMLDQVGFGVIKANSGRMAIEVLREKKDIVDCVLLDLTMTPMDGKEALNAIRSIEKNIPVIISSGYDEADLSGVFVDIKPDGFIQKPFLLSTLKTKIEDVISRRRDLKLTGEHL